MNTLSTVSLLLLLTTKSLGQIEEADTQQELTNTTVSESPEAVVQRQLDAYNARDIEALLETYA
jgi:hypothetical protein